MPSLPPWLVLLYSPYFLSFWPAACPPFPRKPVSCGRHWWQRSASPRKSGRNDARRVYVLGWGSKRTLEWRPRRTWQGTGGAHCRWAQRARGPESLLETMSSGRNPTVCLTGTCFSLTVGPPAGGFLVCFFTYQMRIVGLGRWLSSQGCLLLHPRVQIPALT